MKDHLKFKNNPVLGDRPTRSFIAPKAGFSTFRESKMDDFKKAFWENTKKEGNCVVWQGLISNGYGQVYKDGKTRWAHRVAWEITNGSIPKGLNVLHKCDNKPCVNPEHLFLGTQSDNLKDSVRKGRFAMFRSMKQFCPNGHKYDVNDMYIDPTTGHRHCRICRRANSKKWNITKREARHARKL